MRLLEQVSLDQAFNRDIEAAVGDTIDQLP